METSYPILYRFPINIYHYVRMLPYDKNNFDLIKFFEYASSNLSKRVKSQLNTKDIKYNFYNILTTEFAYVCKNRELPKYFTIAIFFPPGYKYCSSDTSYVELYPQNGQDIMSMNKDMEIPSYKIGISFCGENDNPCKEFGRLLAVNRLSDKMKLFGKHTKRMLWNNELYLAFSEDRTLDGASLANRIFSILGKEGKLNAFGIASPQDILKRKEFKDIRGRLSDLCLRLGYDKFVE